MAANRGPSGVYQGLMDRLGQYLSEASITASVDLVLSRRGLSPATLDRQQLAEVVAEAMVGLRMFCDPARIGDLMMDLAEYCESVGADGPDPG